MDEQMLTSSCRYRAMASVGLLSAICAVVALFPAEAAFSNEDQERAELGPGCAPDRPAIAHHAAGLVVNDARGPAPIPCVTSTGWRTYEIGFIVTNNGDLVLQPTFLAAGMPIGAIHSSDQGATWEFLQPSNPQDPLRASGFDQNMGVDRLTGRVFWLAPGYKSAVVPQETSRLDASDDNGAKFFRASIAPLGNPDPIAGQVSRDHGQVFAGPAPRSLRNEMKTYPNVVYVCQSNAPQLCGRSLDGGKTFSPPVGIPLPPECDGPSPPLPETVPYNTNFGLRGVVDEEGNVYVPNTPCEIPYIAVSNDGASTWKLVRVADTQVIGFGMLSLDIDSAQNLYAVWSDVSDRLPRLSISRDRGAHWSSPLLVGAPGVNESALPSVVAGELGHVAVTYYGSTNSPGPPFPAPCTGVATSCPAYANETWNTYITETWTALKQDPVFWSAPINNPAQPTWYGCSPSELGIVRLEDDFKSPPGSTTTAGCIVTANYSTSQGGGRIDYYGLSMAVDGTPWVGFVQACPNGQRVPGNPNCDQAAGGPNDALFGLVGRLVRVKE